MILLSLTCMLSCSFWNVLRVSMCDVSCLLLSILRCAVVVCLGGVGISVHSLNTQFQIALIANLKESRHPRRCRSVALTMTSLSHCQFLAQVLAASRGLKPNRLRNQFVSHMSSNFKLQTSVVVDFRSKSCSEQTGLGSLVSCSLFTVLFLFV